MPRIHVAVRLFAAMDPAGMARLLAPDDYQQLSSRAELRQRQLLGRACRRELLAGVLDCDPATLQFAYMTGGKPFLPQHTLSFSLSHSHTALALAWSKDGIALGIDIEDRARRVRMDAIASSCFSRAEAAAWEAADHDVSLWLSIWTRKEALLKCNGLGLRMPLAELDTSHTDCHGHIHHDHLGHMALQSWAIDAQLLSLAWPAGNAPAEIILDFPSRRLDVSLPTGR